MRIMEVLVVFVVTLPVHAQAYRMPDTATCSIPGWIANVDPNGVAVRGKPAPDAPIRARLPTTIRTEYLPIAVTITASSNGWSHIERPSFDPHPPDPPAPAMPQVKGWVHNSAIEIIVQGRRGRAGPSTTAPIVDEFQEGWLSDSARIDRLLDCQDGWVKVEYRHLGQWSRVPPYSRAAVGPVMTAWFTGLCGIQETTCDMPTID